MREHLKQELVNVLTHGLGFLGAIAVGVLLITLATQTGSALHIVSFSLFSASLMLLYLGSTLYHIVPFSSNLRSTFHKIDQIFIFIMIAGTYTPVTLTVLLGAWGWTLFGLIWSLALVGVATKLLWRAMPRWFPPLLYLLMGWLGVVAFVPLRAALTNPELLLLITGGVLYSTGVIFYALHNRITIGRHVRGHELFHLFVLGGSAAHIILMFMLLS